MTRILVPLAPHWPAEEQLDVASLLALRLGASLRLVTLLDGEESEYTGYIQEGLLGRSVARCRKAGAKATLNVLSTAPGESATIPERLAALAKGSRIVVIGHRRFDPIYRFTHQSTAQDLINLAECPVVVVPTGRWGPTASVKGQVSVKLARGDT